MEGLAILSFLASFRFFSFVFPFMKQMTGSWFFIFWRLGCLTCHSLLFDLSLTFVSTGLPFFSDSARGLS
jgi:hypothetical protein